MRDTHSACPKDKQACFQSKSLILFKSLGITQRAELFQELKYCATRCLSNMVVWMKPLFFKWQKRPFIIYIYTKNYIKDECCQKVPVSRLTSPRQKQKRPSFRFFVQTILPKIEAALFMWLRWLYLVLSGPFTSPNLERKPLLHEKIVFAFSNQHQCPWAPLVSHRTACLLCFIENFLPAPPAAGGRRGGGEEPLQYKD